MVMLNPWLAIARALRRHAVRVVKPDQTMPVRIVQRERIAQPVRPFWRRLRPLDLELQPVALGEVVNAAIKSEQKLKGVFVRNSRPRPIGIMS